MTASKSQQTKQLTVVRGRQAGGTAEDRTGAGTFTGTVWANPVLPPTDGVTINSVFFAPGGRTHWHTHTGGQVLSVTSGSGWVQDRDGSGGRIVAGDTVHIPPGVEHWHGADADCYLVHTAIAIGSHDWLDPVDDADYGDEQ